ncbi:MAG: insulinase family protein, partial [Calditrichaeota bacterium]
RLYKALVDQNLAVNTFVSYTPHHDPGLFIVYGFLAPGVTHEEVEKEILHQLDSIRTHGVQEDEVRRAINQVIAQTAYGRDGSFSIAMQINEAIAMGDWTFYVTFKDKIQQVTPEDVQRVAQKYFIEDKSTTGYFIPESSQEASLSPANSQNSFQEKQQLYFRRDDNLSGSNSVRGGADPDQSLTGTRKFFTKQIPMNSQRKKVEGIDLVTVETGVEDVITFVGSLPAGDLFSPEENSMVADLTGQMLDKGTKQHGKFELAEILENLGAEINFSVSNYTLNFRGRCLKKDLGVVIQLLAEQLRYPAFSAKELEKVKKQRIGTLKRMMENTSVRAAIQMSQIVFPQDHPNYQESLDKQIQDVEKVTVDEIKEFYEKYYGPNSMIMVAVGDLKHKEVQKQVGKWFKGWSGGVSIPEFPRASMTAEPIKKVVVMKDKTSATLRIGHASTLKKTDPDYLPLMVGNYIFGGNFSARLMSIIRDDEGLTYGIRSSLSNDTYCDGLWYIEGTFAPQLVNQGLESTMRELNRWVQEGVTAEELQNKKTTLVGSFKVRLATTRGMAQQVLSFLQRGLDVDYLNRYPQDINSLTLEEVNNAIQKYIHPEKVVTVIAGSVNESGEPLGSE